MSNYKVSVIMPVFNMESMILEAIESWKKQSLKEKELICVDDCSTDRTKKLIEESAASNNNIKLISLKENSGAGIARNRGMEAAQGEYLAFLDGDDYYACDEALEIIYKYAKKDMADVAGGLFTVSNRGVNEPFSRFRNLFLDNETEYQDINYFEIQDDYYFQGYLFRTDYLRKRNILFPPYRRFQDPPFLVKALYNADYIRAINKEFYVHREGYKAIEYSADKLVGLVSGLVDNLLFAEDKHLSRLLESTIRRLNFEYFPQLYHGIRKHEPRLLEKVTQAYTIAKRNGFHIDALEYLFYLERHVCKYDEFLQIRNLHQLLNGKRKLIIYGAGMIGQRLFGELYRDEYYEMVLWADKGKNGQEIMGTVICNLFEKDLNEIEYDAVIIAIENSSISHQIVQDLLEFGISEKAIVQWKDAM